ncbi:hypothetical protein BCR34DRAFT_355400 [Clohesyomyces aquaticus]|uniref:Uncharacterized protein n=1 Tax=Clohesyomyces aquaticus TaxID=1231657 RepID=A0A1Y1ZIZ2_9PLEO|nr:hypothetical protein BCR34DRAFT_355400 [Clohesyomyces aquaticus]
MQTRLVELHFLLYDFCGVLVLLATVTVAVPIYLRLYLAWSERLAKWDTNAIFHEGILPIIDYSTWAWIVVSWALLLSSFLVGMIKDVGLGLKILGIGAVIIGGGLLLTACGVGLLWSVVADFRCFWSVKGINTLQIRPPISSTTGLPFFKLHIHLRCTHDTVKRKNFVLRRTPRPELRMPISPVTLELFKHDSSHSTLVPRMAAISTYLFALTEHAGLFCTAEHHQEVFFEQWPHSWRACRCNGEVDFGDREGYFDAVEGGRSSGCGSRKVG